MRLGLLGFPIEHSLSPMLYKKFLGEHLESYELYSFDSEYLIPPLEFFSKKLHGLNITSPYKRHFLNKIEITSPMVRTIGAVNTIAFKNDRAYGTNTDASAIMEILKKYLSEYNQLNLLLLGDGVMAGLTQIIAQELGIPVMQFSRKNNPDMSNLDLRPYSISSCQTIVINACSRDFVFRGELKGSEIFWDYNYSFDPHSQYFPARVYSYCDGQEMLELQAMAAIKFWETYI